MKKILKRIAALSLAVTLGATMVACDSSKTTTPESEKSSEIIPSSTNTSIETSESTVIEPIETSTSIVIEPTETSTESEASKIATLVNVAIAKLDELVNPFIAKISNEALKTSIQNYYNNEKEYLRSISDLETAKAAGQKVVDDTKAFVKGDLMTLATEKLNSVVNPLISAIPDDDLKNSTQNYYNTELRKLSSVETLADISDTFDEIVDDTKKFIKTETAKVLITLKNKALEELDPYVSALIAKIPYDDLKTDTQAFYNQEKAKLQAVDTIEGVQPCVNEIENDLEVYALTKTKEIAVSKLQEVVDAGLAKIPNEDVKKDLTDFAEEEIAKLNAITKIEDVPTTLETVLTETANHITELMAQIVKEYLKKLTDVEKATAYDYLPVAMCPTYQNNLVNASSIAYDFTNNTNVSAINKAGYGEQWQMVVENINQSVAMAKVFNIAQTALSSAGATVELYITNSYAEEMSYDFTGSIYTGKFEFKNNKLIFNISFTSNVNVPIAGSIQPVIKMEYDLVKDAKGMFISLGDAYKIKYVVSKDTYEMATTYGISLLGHTGTRSSYLSIVKESNKTTGHIYEYTTLDGSDKISACADFYVENGYVSVVGNKASGMVGFDGYVNELYKASEGKLLGYEVREEKTIAGVKGTYNTLWFNLWDIDGITNVKVTDKTDANESSRSTVDVYLNNSTNLLSPTYNKKIIKTSRKYDVELRSRFYYTYDSENDVYVSHEVLIPMMFIQEGDNYNSFVSDFKEANSIDVSVSLNSTYLNKITSDYHSLIDIFITNKENMSSEEIISYLAQYE